MDFFIRAMLEKVGGTGVLLGTDVYMVKGKQRDESLVEDAQDLLGRAISELSIAYSEASKGSSDIIARIDSVIELLLNARK
jgi:hypothetical protein